MGLWTVQYEDLDLRSNAGGSVAISIFGESIERSPEGRRSLELALRIFEPICEPGNITEELAGPGKVLAGERLLRPVEAGPGVRCGFGQVAARDPVAGQVAPRRTYRNPQTKPLGQELRHRFERP